MITQHAMLLAARALTTASRSLRWGCWGFLASLLWNQGLGASMVLEQKWDLSKEWKAGQKVGEVTARHGATITPVVAIAAEPARTEMPAEFEFDFGPDQSARHREAETARLTGVTIYQDAVNASGGTAVGAFGRKLGDAIVFTNLPAADELNVFYNNGTGKRKQCSLYADDRKIATLQFEDTKGWYVPFVIATHQGRISGDVKLQVDSVDLEVNGGDFCCNVDRIVAGPATARPTIEVRVTPGELAVQAGMAYFNCGVRGPKGFQFSLGIEDASKKEHWSHGHVLQGVEGWEYVAVALADFEPGIEASAAPFQAVRLRAESNWKGLRGKVILSDLRLTRCWPSNSPKDCPSPRSEAFAGIRFTGRTKYYTEADTWYPSWASDGNQYSPYTDGTVEGIYSISCVPNATTGMARIEGDDPLNLKVRSLGVYVSRPAPYDTRYPCGSLVHNGIWYFGTYIINNKLPDGSQNGEAHIGPFVGFRYSQDFGKTWTETPCTPEKNLFDEKVGAVPGGFAKIRMGSPHFVDFGRNMEHSPDGKAYLVAHGCANPAALNTWILGDQINLARVTPSVTDINDGSQYEFFAGDGIKGTAAWTSKFSGMKPLFDWPRRAGCVTMTYNAPLKKYFMCVSNGTRVDAPFDTYILESSTIVGPWKLVTYMAQFGAQAYFVNLPSKFISTDGGTMWLCYAANWTGHKQNPKGSVYAMCLHEIQLVGKQ